MATLSRDEIVGALERLGDLAQARGMSVELYVVGGAAMVMAYGAREATRDVDVVVLAPREVALVRDIARIIATERAWPDDWLNDGAKGYLVGLSQGEIVLTAPGIVVRRPSVEQLLAMKLSAWRDDVDIADARRLLEDVQGDEGAIWAALVQYVVPGCELKARDALSDLWEERHGHT